MKKHPQRCYSTEVERAGSVSNIGEVCAWSQYITPEWYCHSFAVVARFHPRLVPPAKIQIIIHIANFFLPPFRSVTEPMNENNLIPNSCELLKKETR